MSEKEKTNSEIYKKLSQIEHVLLRPDTYIGSIESIVDNRYVIENNDLTNIRIVKNKVNDNPGFVKLFSEIIDNCLDHYIKTKTVKMIKVNIYNKKITIFNDGTTLPLEIHDNENIYIPQLVLLNLLSGSNYDDEEVRVSIGKNGVGAKATAIMSKRFIIECCDGKKLYKQVAKNNLSIIEEPVITDCKPDTKSYTKITYYPDFERFELECVTDDLRALMYKKALDISAYIPNVRVSVDNKTIPVKSEKDYMKMHLDEDADFFYEELENGWKVGISSSPSLGFEGINILNGNNCYRGGSNLNYIALELSKDIVNKFPKKIKTNWAMIKNKLFIFLISEIPNPSFDTQSKNFLTNRMTTEITGGCKVSDKTVKKIMKSDIVRSILDEIELREKLSLKRLSSGKKKTISIEKLIDANKSGTKDSGKCSILLTEGDSALTSAVSGMSVVGREYYGAMPLKGKVLNVRSSSAQKIRDNKEIQNIIKILGLEIGKVYENTDELRYGKCIIFTDADVDGIHIKGLIMNMFEEFWPELLKMDFLYEFITPILKARKGKDIKSFYTMKDYNKALNSGKIDGYSIKYYKGLGTSTSIESKSYFKEIDKHLLPFKWDTDNNTDKIDMIFNEKRAEDRKHWLLTTTPKPVDKYGTPTPISSFLSNEMITFSLHDNIRSIPDLYDGLKPSQRKIMNTCIKRNITKDTPVSSLAGSVKETQKYHSGEASLEQGIVNLAQNYIGSNNLNLLQPEGQFGSRLQGGKDAASSRYINTFLSPITKYIYRPEDNNILDYLEEDGTIIEPKTFKPIIPMVLINGSEGIGTGWSSNVPMFNVKDIIRVIENKLNDKRSNKIHPSFNNFKGVVRLLENGNYVTVGIFDRINTSTLSITELPIGTWTYTYINYLNKLVEDKFIKAFEDNSTEDNVNITINIPRENMLLVNDDELLVKKFRLQNNIYMTNMNLFVDGKITKFDSAMDIINVFYNKRLEDYKTRKKYMLERLCIEQDRLSNMVKFIKLVISDKLKINNRKKSIIIKEMKKNKLMEIEDSYSYLLNMSIYSLTKEKVDELNNQLKKKEVEHKNIKKTTIKKFWLTDLIELRGKL